MRLCLVFISALVVSTSALQDRHGSTTYGTKTPYFYSHNEAEWQIIFNSQRGDYYAPPPCKPISVDVLYRHGMRNPGDDDIVLLKNLALRIRGKVRNPKYATLNNWRPPFKVEDASQLIGEGRRELYTLGKAIAKRYRNFFKYVTSDDLLYQASSRKRTVDSGRSFQAGFSAALRKNLTGPFVNREDILRFYDNCNKYTDQVEDNDDALREISLYYESPRLKRIPMDVTWRLRLRGIDLTFEEIEVIYSAISAEATIVGSSPWHGVFTEEELALLEYGADLKNYWEESYAYDISWFQSCGLLTSFVDQMMDAMKKEASGKSYKKGVFRFAHSQAVLGISTLLEILPPGTPLRADNYRELLKTRRFRSGTIAPMAANLGFILYKCDPKGKVGTPPVGVTWPRKLETYMFELLLNELPYRLPVCDYDLCPYQTFKDVYSELGYIGCDTEKVCKI